MKANYYTIALLYNIFRFQELAKSVDSSTEVEHFILENSSAGFEISIAEIKELLPFLQQTDHHADFPFPNNEVQTLWPLLSIFQDIQTQEQIDNTPPKAAYYPIQPLSLETDIGIMPTRSSSIEKGSYLTHFKKFKEEFTQIQSLSLEAYNTTLFSLLKKYTWYLPAKQEKGCSVSFYAAAKSQMAFALAALVHQQNKESEGSQFPYLLYAGDASGIQSFIYNITSSKAAKSLKGRSFFIQILIDAILGRLLKLLELSETQIIYASGGRYYVLLPNTRQIKKQLATFHEALNRHLWERYKGALYVANGYLPFSFANATSNNVVITPTNSSESETKQVRFHELWKMVADQVSVSKTCRFKKLIQSDFSKIFKPSTDTANLKITPTGTVAVCKVTGAIIHINGTGPDKAEDMADADEKDSGKKVWVHKDVKLQSKIAETLRFADYLLISSKEVSAEDTISFDPLESLVLGDQCKPQFFTLIKKEFLRKEIQLTEQSTLIRINNTEPPERETLLNEVLLGHRFMFYGGNRQALTDDYQLAEFTDLAAFEDQTSSDGNKIGILRMDVDNLGQIFTQGLPLDKRNFATYATLSAQLDFFFSGFLNTIREEGDFKDHLNIIYAGGDDVFAVGRWDTAIDFAARIRDEFRKYVCGRSDISISAGLTIVNPKFPIAKAALLAGEAEEHAKSYELVLQKQTYVKDAINCFGITVNWSKEWKIVETQKNALVKLITSDQLPKSVLHQVFKLWSIIVRNQQIRLAGSEKEEDLSWIWNAAFHFSRMGDRIKDKSAAANKELKKISNYFIAGNYNGSAVSPQDGQHIALLVLAARWTEYLIRKDT